MKFSFFKIILECGEVGKHGKGEEVLLLLNIPGNLTLCFYDKNVNHGHMALLWQFEYKQLACGYNHVQRICNYFPQIYIYNRNIFIMRKISLQYGKFSKTRMFSTDI